MTRALLELASEVCSLKTKSTEQHFSSSEVLAGVLWHWQHSGEVGIVMGLEGTLGAITNGDFFWPLLRQCGEGTIS